MKRYYRYVLIFQMDKIIITDPKDILFTKMCIRGIVGGVTLPSSKKIPPPDEGRYWVVTEVGVITSMPIKKWVKLFN